MCGIGGVLELRGRPTDSATVERMARVIRHRGPDDEGTWTNAVIGLANVRLAIIDPSPAGHQPMATQDGSVVLVYNGELYNFQSIRRELEAHGHRFRSSTDTEVVLHAYVEWGQRCVERFNGMFALAIWDERRGELFLARDRFGIKPLYYTEYDGQLLFASEVKALLEAGLPARVCPQALVEYFTFQNVFSDLTLFEDVRVLPAGCTLTARADGTRISRYWDLELEPDESIPAERWAVDVLDAFEASVTRQLVSDVPVGGYLSGGMDSASIAAVACRSIPRLMTFTGGFDVSSVEGLEMVFDERADAERIARTFRTEHYEMVMHAGDMAWVLPELVWHLEDLRVGMCYQNHYIARLASKFVKVALAGTGGDELFAGYPWRYAVIEHAQNSAEFEQAYFDYWTRLVPDADKTSFFEQSLLRAVGDHVPRDVFRAVLEPAREYSAVDRALYFEAKTFLHGLLVVEDRVSMAHSLESRVPFLDNELVDVARRIPSRLKHADQDGKRLLREAMSALLPEDILDKRKQGFSPPDRSWYRGPSMDYIREILLDPRTTERGYFQPAYIGRVLDEHLDGRVNHRLLIWSLLCFEWWNRLFIDGDARSRHGQWHSDAASLPALRPSSASVRARAD